MLAGENPVFLLLDTRPQIADGEKDENYNGTPSILTHRFVSMHDFGLDLEKGKENSIDMVSKAEA